jgi:hypothetical protein
MMATAIWFECDGTLGSHVLHRSRWLSAGGPLRDERGFDSLLVAPVQRCEGAVAALLVPAELRGRVAHNGMMADVGLVPLRHAAHVQIDDWSLWVAGEFVPEETEYSPTRHEPEARCFISKARLREGEPITRCPGQAGKPCGMIFKRSAWQTVIAATTRFLCPNCGFDPRAGVWRPEPIRPRQSLEHVFELLNLELSR